MPRYVWNKKEFSKFFRPGPWPFYHVYQHRLKVLVSTTSPVNMPIYPD